nr:tripartite tricarboxylate transporter substrate-binding protein [Roseococcus sp. MDT2-1-1]
MVDLHRPLMAPPRDPLRSLIYHAANRAVRRVVVSGETIWVDGRTTRLDVVSAGPSVGPAGLRTSLVHGSPPMAGAEALLDPRRGFLHRWGVSRRIHAMHRRALLSALPLFAASNASGQESASWPGRPLRIIVPFGAGSTTDLLGRLVAQRLGEALGQPVVVENRPGAGGNIGTEAAARAPADGHTLLMGAASTNAINPSLYRSLRFDPIRDFAPVALVGLVTNVLVVPPSLPAASVPELIALARTRPLSFASGGAGGSIHLSGELFRTMAGLDMVHVPYNGGAAALPDLLSGRVDLMFDGLPTSLPHIRAGRLRALGVTSAQRSPVLPDVPTVAEAALPGYEAEGWFGLFAPAATPAPILDRLHRELARMLAEPAVIAQLAAQGARAGDKVGDEFGRFALAERDKWGAVIRAAGITLD